MTNLGEEPAEQSIRSFDTNPGEPLYQVKLLNALRSGEPAFIHSFLAEIVKARQRTHEGDSDVGAAALHLAIRCASVDTVAFLLSYRPISPNGVHPPGSGTTPLHLAASLGRADVVNILLDQEGIDDTLLDRNGKTCKEVANGRAVIKVIEDSHSFLNASYRSLLHAYIFSPPTAQPSPSLIALLNSPRVRYVDLDYLDDDSGTSFLHEAAKRKDHRLIELILRAGADIFLRDRRGRMAYEGAGKDDRIKAILRQYANHDATLIEPSPLSEPPVLKGYLNKYTNVARGYNTRWFVLRDGILSYYRHQEDETIASRGSISMKTAILKVAPGVDRLRFEVHSTPSHGHRSGVQKWYLKANHHAELRRWTSGIRRSIDWHKREPDKRRRLSCDSDATGPRPTDGSRSAIAPSLRKFRSTATEGGSGSSFSGMADDEDSAPGYGSSTNYNRTISSGLREEEDSERNNDSSASGSDKRIVPHESTFELHGNSLTAQVELTAQLLSNLTLPPGVPIRTQETKSALRESFEVVQSMLNEYIQMVKDRDDFWQNQLEREWQRHKAWEDSLQFVVKEGEALERELRQRSRRRTSRFADTSTGSALGTLKGKPTPLALLPGSESDNVSVPHGPSMAPALASAAASLDVPPETILTPTPKRQQEKDALMAPASPGEGDTDEEDQFFDAIEFNTLPNLIVAEPLTSARQDMPPPYFGVAPYMGYKSLRQRLSIDVDNRPSTSLWSVLKHSIGKDLTKISFPVFFNEPTSMLQRMAEDMEFSECLDAAAREEDPHRRIAFVAAFAMSNYSSTIGRIAKPFNPMLSETFEYVRLDKGYRYISEQVSHHPPISACWAESPLWNYFGEVFARNKFMGKSFEIEPTGIAHAELLIPEKWTNPKAKGKQAEGNKVVEHFSWKKVTTNVSGFILGSPTIDHYGDMTVTNHRTGDQCVLTFKPRGWRGKDAFEISGYVQDASGKITYEVAGRWNSQLVARAVGTGTGLLHPDVQIPSADLASAAPEYILLWRNSEKHEAPFNLTPFAITLNDCPPTLRSYLCPTDCRLRPDQRAFELGKYTLANELKNEQEERQRAARKAREEGALPMHQPRWFMAETDGDTGERVWSPVRIDGRVEYWLERERVWREGGGRWKDVEPIFIDEPKMGDVDP